MAKVKTKFICQECGYETPRWMGKCPGCNAWNTLVEETITANVSRTGFSSDNGLVAPPRRLNEVEMFEHHRATSGMIELDRVLGGGVVMGSLVLIGGDPGIGKSTLLLQMCKALSKETQNVLYVSGEESVQQIKMRAERMNVTANYLFLAAENNMEIVFNHIEKIKPSSVIIDSIQTVYTSKATSAPGSVTQVREVTAMLMEFAKKTGTTVFIVGHVTKEGSLAGPRVLEHMVDTVLYFEGDRHQTYRILRTVKNRFGSTNEIGVFEMKQEGLCEVLNPSEMLLSGRNQGAAGSVVLCSMEGTRSVLVEIQALVSTTAFGMARRMATGVDYNRTLLLLAVLEKKAGMQLFNQDAYVNAAGGFKVDEPAADLAIAGALASSFKNVAMKSDVAVMGEVGLTGEVRGISRIDQRLNECSKLGFKQCIIPQDNLRGLNKRSDLNIIAVKNINEFLQVAFNN
jgi:DNA repair protein RadA/Sms